MEITYYKHPSSKNYAMFGDDLKELKRAVRFARKKEREGFTTMPHSDWIKWMIREYERR